MPRTGAGELRCGVDALLGFSFSPLERTDLNDPAALVPTTRSAVVALIWDRSAPAPDRRSASFAVAGGAAQRPGHAAYRQHAEDAVAGAKAARPDADARSLRAISTPCGVSGWLCQLRAC
ncbi:hypothetical protein ACRAWF_06490 [Streptomyces sp. L7]